MATKKVGTKAIAGGGSSLASSPIEEMLLAALERGDDTLETGRYLVTFKEGAAEEGMQSLGAQGMRVADAREFTDQAVTLENVGDADAVAFPEIGVALVGGDAAQARGMSVQMEAATDSAIESIDPEYFMFPANSPAEYLHGFLRAAETIAKDLLEGGGPAQAGTEVDAQVLGATWGLTACKVPPSLRSGIGIKVAVLDTGFDLGHPDFAGRHAMRPTARCSPHR